VEGHCFDALPTTAFTGMPMQSGRQLSPQTPAVAGPIGPTRVPSAASGAGPSQARRIGSGGSCSPNRSRSRRCTPTPMRLSPAGDARARAALRSHEARVVNAGTALERLAPRRRLTVEAQACWSTRIRLRPAARAVERTGRRRPVRPPPGGLRLRLDAIHGPISFFEKLMWQGRG
jgi:hypothetical protein